MEGAEQAATAGHTAHVRAVTILLTAAVQGADNLRYVDVVRSLPDTDQAQLMTAIQNTAACLAGGEGDDCATSATGTPQSAATGVAALSPALSPAGSIAEGGDASGAAHDDDEEEEEVDDENSERLVRKLRRRLREALASNVCNAVTRLILYTVLTLAPHPAHLVQDELQHTVETLHQRVTEVKAAAQDAPLAGTARQQLSPGTLRQQLREQISSCVGGTQQGVDGTQQQQQAELLAQLTAVKAEHGVLQEEVDMLRPLRNECTSQGKVIVKLKKRVQELADSKQQTKVGRGRS